MAATQTKSDNNGVANIHVASHVESGSAVAIRVETGFKPRYVRVVNQSGNCNLEWFEGMSAAHGVKTVDSGSGTTDISAITSNGITVDDRGYTIGVDTDINVSTEQLRCLALG